MLFDDVMMEKIETYWDMAVDDDQATKSRGLASLKKEIPDLITFSEFIYYISDAAEIFLPLDEEIAYFEEMHGVIEIAFGLGLAIVAEAPFEKISDHVNSANPGIRMLAAATAKNRETMDLLIDDPCVLVRCMVAAATSHSTDTYVKILANDSNPAARDYVAEVFKMGKSRDDISDDDYLLEFKFCSCNTKEKS